MEEGDEDEVYSALVWAMEATWGDPQTEDNLIGKLIQNPLPVVLPLEKLVESTQSCALVDLCIAGLTSPRVKNVEFGPKRTLKVSSSLSPS